MSRAQRQGWRRGRARRFGFSRVRLGSEGVRGKRARMPEVRMDCRREDRKGLDG